MSTSKLLTRSTTNRMLSGVCAGLGDYLGIDPTIIRLIFAFSFFISGGTALLVYLVMSIVVPPDASTVS